VGLRALQISSGLWQTWCTQGNRFGGPGSPAFECVEGLPPGAELEHSFFRFDGERTGVLCLVFSHPSWEGPEEGQDIPDVTVEWRKVEAEPCAGG